MAAHTDTSKSVLEHDTGDPVAVAAPVELETQEGETPKQPRMEATETQAAGLVRGHGQSGRISPACASLGSVEAFGIALVLEGADIVVRIAIEQGLPVGVQYPRLHSLVDQMQKCPVADPPG